MTPHSSESQAASGHQAIAYCPYCSEENLFPTEDGWECRSCLRAFRVVFSGLGARTAAHPAAGDTEAST